jgi:membrane protease subunit (stomatin/prohibitin family)
MSTCSIIAKEQAAGSNPDGGALGLGFMGMGMQGAAGAMGVMQQPMQQSPYSQAASPPPQQASEDPYEKLAKLKGLLDQGVIYQVDFDAVRHSY